MSEYQPIVLELGETWTIQGTLNINNTPIDLTNSVVKWKIASQKELILTVTNSNNIIVSAPTTGFYKTIIPVSLQINTVKLVAGQYRHELSVTLPDSTVTIQYEGPLEVRNSVSNLFG